MNKPRQSGKPRSGWVFRNNAIQDKAYPIDTSGSSWIWLPRTGIEGSTAAGDQFGYIQETRQLSANKSHARRSIIHEPCSLLNIQRSTHNHIFIT